MIQIKLRISPATSKDLKEMYKIELLSYRDPWPKEMFIMDYLFNSNSRYYSAKWMKKVVGFLGLWFEEYRLHIVNIAVHPNYRGRGIGRKIMEFAIKLAEKERKNEIYLEVRESNVSAQKLYQHLGFKFSGEIPDYYSDGERGLIMKKVLHDYSRD